jgi:hypothetical protein
VEQRRRSPIAAVEGDAEGGRGEETGVGVFLRESLSGLSTVFVFWLIYSIFEFEVF